MFVFENRKAYKNIKSECESSVKEMFFGVKKVLNVGVIKMIMFCI